MRLIHVLLTRIRFALLCTMATYSYHLLLDPNIQKNDDMECEKKGTKNINLIYK